jgi:NitT/TauT family transport system permease protein
MNSSTPNLKSTDPDHKLLDKQVKQSHRASCNRGPASDLAWLPLIITIGMVILIWQFGVQLLHVPNYILPLPSAVAISLWTEHALLLQNAVVTSQEILAGFALAVVFSVPVAILIVAYRTFERALYPLIVFSQTVPKIAIAPLFVVWFGFSSLPKILTTFLICFFPIVLDAVLGLRSVSSESVDLLRSMGASKPRTFWELRLPASLPYILSGMKVAITLAVVGAVVGEFVGSTDGLGFVLLQASGSLNTALLFASIIVLTLIGLILYYVLECLERFLIPWHVTQRQEIHGTL